MWKLHVHRCDMFFFFKWNIQKSKNEFICCNHLEKFQCFSVYDGFLKKLENQHVLISFAASLLESGQEEKCMKLLRVNIQVENIAEWIDFKRQINQGFHYLQNLRKDVHHYQMDLLLFIRNIQVFHNICSYKMLIQHYQSLRF